MKYQVPINRDPHHLLGLIERLSEISAAGVERHVSTQDHSFFYAIHQKNKAEWDAIADIIREHIVREEQEAREMAQGLKQMEPEATTRIIPLPAFLRRRQKGVESLV